MSVLTIVYAGSTVYNAEVESFGFEANARGDLFVTASKEPPEPEIEGSTGDPVPDPLNPDGRYTEAELAIIRKRQAPHSEPF